MFLIAGLNPRLKRIGCVPGHCPVCGSTGNLFVVREAQAVSVFFIPVVSFGKRYLATCSSCASVMELWEEAGRQVEENPHLPIRRQDMRVVNNNYHPSCSGCGTRISPDFDYCPGCGKSL